MSKICFRKWCFIFRNPVLKKNIESHYEDLALIERILQKDQDALEKLYYKYNKRLTHFINAFVTTYDDVEDILQITFISALDSLARYNGSSLLFTWLCAIARHKVGDYYRANQKHVDSLDDVEISRQWQLMACAENKPVEECLLDMELRNAVYKVLGMMPEHYRDLLVEKYILGKPLREIVAGRTVTEKAAESLLTRARRYFMRLLEENDYFRGGFYHEEQQ